MISDEVRKFLSEGGKKGGATNRKKGPQYFADMARKRWEKHEKVQKENDPTGDENSESV